MARRLNTPFLLVVLGVTAAGVVIIGGLLYLKTRNDPMRYVRKGDTYMQQGDYRDASAAYMRAIGKDQYEPSFYDLSIDALTKVVPQTQQEANDRFNTHMALLMEKARILPDDQAFDPIQKVLSMNRSLLEGIEVVPGSGAMGAFERIANDFDGLESLPADDAEQAWILNHLLEGDWRFATSLSEVEWENALVELEEMVALDPDNSYNQYALLRGMLDRVFEDIDNNRRSSAQRELSKYQKRFSEARQQLPDSVELDWLEFELAFHLYTSGQAEEAPAIEDLDVLFEKLKEIDDRRILSEFIALSAKLSQIRHVGSMDNFGKEERMALLELRHKLAALMYERDPEDVRNIFLYLTIPDTDPDETAQLARGILDGEMPPVGVNSRLREQSLLRASRLLFDQSYANHTIAKAEYNSALSGGEASEEEIAELKNNIDVQLADLEKSYEVMDGVLSDGAVENKAVRLMAKMDMAYAKGEWDKALQAVNQYLALGNAFDASRLLTAADVSMRAGDFGSATRFADQLMTQRPDLVTNGEFSLIRARLAASSTDFPRAISLANQVIAMESIDDPASQVYAKEAKALLKNLASMRSGVKVTDDPLYKIMSDLQRAKAEDDVDQQRSILLQGIAGFENAQLGGDLDEETRTLNTLRLLGTLALLETTHLEGDADKAQEYAGRLLAIDPENQTGKLIREVAGQDAIKTLGILAQMTYPEDPIQEREQYWILLRNKEKELNANLEQYAKDPGSFTAAAVEKMNEDLVLLSAEAARIESEVVNSGEMSARAHRYQILQSLENRDVDLASKSLAALLEIGGETWRTSLIEAQIRSISNDFEGCLEVLEEAIEAGRSNASLYRAYGRQLLRAGRLSEGLEALSVAHRDAPNNPGIAIDLANALIRMGDSGTALQVMRRSSASGRSSAPYIKLWLNLETVIGEPMVALKERGRIWNLNPLNWENGSEYATLLIEAPVRWTEIRDKQTGQPSFREAEWERLPKSEKQGYIDEVRELRKRSSTRVFKELTSRPNTSPAVFASFADSLESRGDREGAIQVLVDAIESDNSILADGEKAVLAVDLGRRYLDAVKREDAEKWFALAREIQPADNRVADKALVILWRNQNNAVRMVEVLEDLLNKTPKESRNLDRKATARLLVRALLDSAKLEEANEVFDSEFSNSDEISDRLLAGTISISNARQSRINGDMTAAKSQLLAGEELFKAISIDEPGLLEPVLQQALIHDLLYQWTDKAEELDIAIELAREANLKAKSSWVAQELLVTLLLQADEYDSAIGSLEGFLQAMPDSNAARQLLLNIYDSRGMDERAVEVAQQAIERNPFDIGWNVRLGRIRAEQGRYSDASEAFGRLYEMTKDIGLARAFIEMKLLRDPPDINGVMGFARTNRAMFKTDPFLLGAYAATLAYGGQPEQAMNEFEKTYSNLRNAGADETAMQQLMGWLPRIVGKINDDENVPLRTEEIIDDLSNGDPSMASRMILAQLWVGEGDEGTSKAIEHLRVISDSVLNNDDSVAPLATLGALLYRVGDCEAAITAVTRAMELKPNDPPLLNNYAFIETKCGGDYEQAHLMIMKAIDLDPFNAQYLDTLGYVEMMRGNNDAADRWLRKSVNRNKSASNLMHLAELMIKQGDYSGAETLLIEAGDLEPSSEQQENINKLVKQIAAGAEGEVR